MLMAAELLVIAGQRLIELLLALDGGLLTFGNNPDRPANGSEQTDQPFEELAMQFGLLNIAAGQSSQLVEGRFDLLPGL